MNPLPQTLRNRQGEVLDFTLHEPSQPNQSSTSRADWLVILGHGLTANKDRPQLVAVAEALAAAGIPALRLSFSGNGASEGQFAESTPSKSSQDLQDVLDQVSFGRKILYLGHSQGAAVGVLTAAKDERIQGLISLAGMFDVQGFYQREFGEQTAGESQMWDEAEFPYSQAHQQDAQNHGILSEAAAEITCPWLLVHGSADDLVPPADSEAAQASAKPKTKTELIILDQADHAFSGQESKLATQVQEWVEKLLTNR